MAPAWLSAVLPAAMRLLRFHGPAAAGPRLGLEEEGEEKKDEEKEKEKEKEKEGEEKEGGDVVDLSEAEPALPRSMRAFLESGELSAACRWRSGVSGRVAGARRWRWGTC